jgi:hypothetical protein
VVKAKERWPKIGRAIEYLGGVYERGTSTMDDLVTWEIRDLSTADWLMPSDDRVRPTQRDERSGKADGKRKSEGPI